MYLESCSTRRGDDFCIAKESSRSNTQVHSEQKTKATENKPTNNASRGDHESYVLAAIANKCTDRSLKGNLKTPPVDSWQAWT